MSKKKTSKTAKTETSAPVHVTLSALVAEIPNAKTAWNNDAPRAGIEFRNTLRQIHNKGQSPFFRDHSHGGAWFASTEKDADVLAEVVRAHASGSAEIRDIRKKYRAIIREHVAAQ